MFQEYKISPEKQEKLYLSLTSPTASLEVTSQIDTFGEMFSALERKVLNLIFKLDKEYTIILFNQTALAERFNTTRRRINQICARFKKLGIISYRQQALNQCCIYKLSRFFRDPEVLKKIAPWFTSLKYLRYLPKELLSTIFSIANLKLVTLSTRYNIYKELFSKVATNVHKLRARNRPPISQEDIKKYLVRMNKLKSSSALATEDPFDKLRGGQDSLKRGRGFVMKEQYRTKIMVAQDFNPSTPGGYDVINRKTMETTPRPLRQAQEGPLRQAQRGPRPGAREPVGSCYKIFVPEPIPQEQLDRVETNRQLYTQLASMMGKQRPLRQAQQGPPSPSHISSDTIKNVTPPKQKESLLRARHSLGVGGSLSKEPS